MKKLYTKKQLFFLLIVLVRTNSMFGQYAIPNHYCISVKIGFSQWCDCNNSEPTFDSAPKLSESEFSELKDFQNLFVHNCSAVKFCNPEHNRTHLVKASNPANSKILVILIQTT